jgi:ubiquinone/menaquinone biosynthesis C-methylase UbiE|tara:strand:- start:1246 stop:1704 length:459 start_codon:yes stop_codon:yes gene_type:complete
MNYYDQIAEGYDELHKEEQLKKINIIIKELKIKNDKLLDVGCGTAFYHKLFKNYTGIDNSKGMLKKSEANVIHAEAENLPFKDKSFDTVISITAIQNFKDPIKAINEMKRVAKKKIGITILKKAKNLKLVEKELKIFNRIGEDKDIIFTTYL